MIRRHLLQAAALPAVLTALTAALWSFSAQAQETVRIAYQTVADLRQGRAGRRRL
jgi:ABC-type taurine transport system substrate-binding protein